MHIDHIGIVNGSPDEAVRFYRDFLGLEKTKEAILPPLLSEQLFSISEEVHMLVFEGQGMKFEVFICPDCAQPSPDFRHMGLMVDNLTEFIKKTEGAGVKHISAQKGDRTVHFIKDYAGNLIEIKQK